MLGSSWVGIVMVGTVFAFRVSVVVTVTFCLGRLLFFFLSAEGGNGGRGISEESSEEYAGEKTISSSSSIASSSEGVVSLFASSSFSKRASSAFNCLSLRAILVWIGLVVRFGLAFESVAAPSITMG